ncbi:hypothetical protein [Solidesulfovibrio magneticus]|uniref:Uncharacterized protein n=1 Tax=Solidesulfovibrio magneticus (strain ATCC 700980 / DSM 13731 / RS-1) TaxID=573370 RepID=C4XHD8_SOLM1|nr:hypothetical protein [Solidesulfovibrio magneticus]BAH73906.1 hypothetical protein DMR_04150 [Solidesulfovibrio magneticus RS-1]
MTGEGLSLELASGATTAVSSLPVACACLHNGRVVFSDGVALYRVGGDNDDSAAIPVRLTLPPVVCPGPARLGGLALDGLADGRVAITAVSDAGAEAWGELGPAGRGGLPGRAACRLGRQYGHVWSISLRADDGATLDVVALEARFTDLDRRP